MLDGSKVDNNGGRGGRKSRVWIELGAGASNDRRSRGEEDRVLGRSLEEMAMTRSELQQGAAAV